MNRTIKQENHSVPHCRNLDHHVFLSEENKYQEEKTSMINECLREREDRILFFRISPMMVLKFSEAQSLGLLVREFIYLNKYFINI